MLSHLRVAIDEDLSEAVVHQLGHQRAVVAPHRLQTLSEIETTLTNNREENHINRK